MSRHDMKTILVAAALIEEQGKILIGQRKETARHGLLWEFPGGKVKDEEEPRRALVRELKEELGVETTVGALYEVVYHFDPGGPILLMVYRSRIVQGAPRPLGCQDVQWVPAQALWTKPMPEADDPIRRRWCAQNG